MNRQLLDNIKNSMQSAYNLYCTTQIRIESKRGYKNFIKSYSEIERPDPHEYIQYWRRLSQYVDPTGYQIHFTFTGKKDIQFVPKEVYYTQIEPCLNDYTMSKPYRDKNSYERFYNFDVFPVAILRNIDGVFYNRAYQVIKINQVKDILDRLPKNYQRVMLKPSILTGMRTNVRRIDLENESLSLEYLNTKYERNYLIQEFVEQAKQFNQFGKTVSIRMNTYRSVVDNKIFVHDRGMAFNNDQNPDREQTSSDNISIDEFGRLGSFALNKHWRISRTVPNTDIQFSDFGEIPYFKEMQKAASQIALASPYHRKIGMDMIVDKNGKVVVYEINYDRLGFEIIQYINGALFKEYTDEIIEYCKQRKSKIKFVFTR
ncbi:sugar-transfer associated ATP-grasp domain-containing protein [Candidatus Neomarinimicrobiota bacterium]